MSAGIRAGSSNDGYVQVNGNDIITALSGGNVGIGNTSPSTKLHVNGTVTATAFAGAVTGTSSGNPTLANGSNNRVITATGSNALTGEVAFTFDGSTATINGNTTDTPLILTSTSNNGSHMRFQKDGANKHFVGCGGGFSLGDVDDLSFRTVDNIIFGVGTSEKVRITGAGKLQVKSSGENAVSISLLDNNSTNEIWRVGQAADGDGYVEVLEDGGTVGCKLDASGNSFTMGNFGIGDASPSQLLTISHAANTTNGILIKNTNNSQGSAIAQLELSGGDNAHARVQFECNGKYSTIRHDGNGHLDFYTDGSNKRLTIGSTGNFGLGTSNTSAMSGHTNIFLGGMGNLYSETTAASGASLSVSNNAYINSSGNWVYRTGGKATNIYHYNGMLGVRTGATGSAGNTISWIEKFKIGEGYAGTVDVKGIPAHLRLYSQRNTSDWDSGDPIGKLDFYVGDDTSNNLPYNTNFIHSVCNHLDNQNEPAGDLIFGSCRTNQSGGAVETMRLSHDVNYDNHANLQTQGVGAIRDVYNMMNIAPDGSFDSITNNSDGGGTTWTVQNGTTIRLYNTSGGHGGNWGRGIALRQAGWYYWRMCVRLTTTCTYIHNSTATNKYRYPIGLKFYLHASGDGNTSNIQLWEEFATSGTCNGNQSGTGTLSHGTMVTKTGNAVYLPKSTYQPIYHTNGYQGVRELNIYSLELVQCGAPTSGHEHNGTW